MMERELLIKGLWALSAYRDPQTIPIVEHNGRNHYVSEHQTMLDAAKLLTEGGLKELMFDALVAGMRARGLQRLYEDIMQIPMPS